MSDEEVIEEEEPSPEDALAQALARAEKAEAEIAYREADMVNLRRRNASEKADLIKYGGIGLAGRVLPVLDSLQKALEGAEEGPFSEGVRLTAQNLISALEAEGVTSIPTDGPFDPNTMEAITTVPSTDEHAEGSVIDTLESGWMYKERVLRPARVVVAKD